MNSLTNCCITIAFVTYHCHAYKNFLEELNEIEPRISALDVNFDDDDDDDNDCESLTSSSSS